MPVSEKFKENYEQTKALHKVADYMPNLTIHCDTSLCVSTFSWTSFLSYAFSFASLTMLQSASVKQTM
jgi:hypothetical protein